MHKHTRSNNKIVFLDRQTFSLNVLLWDPSTHSCYCCSAVSKIHFMSHNVSWCFSNIKHERCVYWIFIGVCYYIPHLSSLILSLSLSCCSLGFMRYWQRILTKMLCYQKGIASLSNRQLYAALRSKRICRQMQLFISMLCFSLWWVVATFIATDLKCSIWLSQTGMV